MARRALDVIGRPVVTAGSGQKLGTVSDLLLDEVDATVIALVVRHGVLKTESVLPVAAVQTLGTDAVVSRSSELVSAREWRQRRPPQALSDRAPAPSSQVDPLD